MISPEAATETKRDAPFPAMMTRHAFVYEVTKVELFAVINASGFGREKLTSSAFKSPFRETLMVFFGLH